MHISLGSAPDNVSNFEVPFSASSDPQGSISRHRISRQLPLHENTMASTLDTTANAIAPSSAPLSPRGRRGRGRGSTGHNEGRDFSSDRGRGGGQKAGRGRGGRGNRGSRGGRGGIAQQEGSSAAGGEPETSPRPPPPPLPGNGSFGARLTEDANTKQGDSSAAGNGGDATGEADAEVCFICASPVIHNSVAPCNHRTCHICALRLRALYKNKGCAHCRTQADHVIFTDDAEKRYEEFVGTDFTNIDDNLGIKYEKNEIFEDTVLLLRYNCPDEGCDVACLGWPDLHRHVRRAHDKMMCDLCTRNKKVFTHEHELFTRSQLQRHEKFGDDNPGAIDQSGFRGHPECGFCRIRFYGDDELYTHCRDRHERCHLCDRRNGGRNQQYYIDYNALEEHFSKDHFMCPDKECLEKKFVVFESEMDLKAHQLEAHPNGLTKDARRDARRVDMSAFDYRAPHENERGRGRREGGRGRGDRGERQGRGRGRDPNVDPIPHSSAQPLSRAEVAYQRQMEIQSAQSTTPRTFGGQLTTTDAFAAAPNPQSQALAQNTVTARRPGNTTPQTFPALDSSAPSGMASPPRNTALTPQEQARKLRHNAVTERASNMLRNDQTKLAEFRARITAFRNSNITAAEMIDAFFSLFDTNASELGKLIKEVAEIFEIPTKKDALFKAWNDWKAINEDYPSLPGGNGVPAGTSSASLVGGGSRVLRLKSSTAQSSRSVGNRQASWGQSFPSLSAAVSAGPSNTVPGMGGPAPRSVPKPTWTASSASSSARPSPAPSRVASSTSLAQRPKAPGSEAFPALPAAAKPTSSLFTPGYNGRAILRVGGGASPSPWDPAGASSTNGASNGAEVAEEASGGSKKKGNKNKKQVLNLWG